MKAHCVPFHQVPHTTRLFSDFLYDYPKVQKFYPSSPHILQHGDIAPPPYDEKRRKQVAAVLERQNRSWNASTKTLHNVVRFRAGASVIITGQQVGLFGGPAFALYKALTAIKFAEEATSTGVDTVPVFWLASEDHDLAEIDHVSVIAHDFSLQHLHTSTQSQPNAPVGTIPFGQDVASTIDRASEVLGDSEIISKLRETYRPGENFGDAFARLFAKLFAEFGLILLDPAEPELHRIAQPILHNAIEHAAELDAALLDRGKELERAGYHQQVKVTETSTLLFSIQNGTRTVVHRKANGTIGENLFQIGSEKLSQAELLRRIAEQPGAFSGNALFRPVIQDYLLPTLAYIGGPAEVAYFAQSAVVYERLLGRVTPILPRFSATIAEPKPASIMQRYGLTFPDVLQSSETLREELARRALPADVQSAFDQARTAVRKSVEQVKQSLKGLDITLLEAATRAGSKMEYQIDRLRARAARAELRRVEVLGRHASLLSNALFPARNLQEREVGGIYFISRYGTEFLQTIYRAIRSDCLDHQVIEL